MVTIGTIMIIIIITITSMNRTLSFQHLRFLYLPKATRECFIASLQREQFCHSITISITLQIS